LDAVASFSFPRDARGKLGHGWVPINGTASIPLVMVFLRAWPASSRLMVGLFVGISLILDGRALVMIGS
jgi:uncharacterized membrane protein HdeD (DUF308 family)